MKKINIGLISLIAIGMLFFAFGRSGVAGRIVGADLYNPTFETFGFTSGSSGERLSSRTGYGSVLVSPFTGYAQSMSVSISLMYSDISVRFAIFTPDGATQLGSTSTVSAQPFTTASFATAPLLNTGTPYLLFAYFTFGSPATDHQSQIRYSTGNQGIQSGSAYSQSFPSTVTLQSVVQGKAYALSCVVAVEGENPPPNPPAPPETITLHPTVSIPTQSFVGNPATATITIPDGTAPYTYQLRLDTSIAHSGIATSGTASYTFTGLTLGDHTASVYVEDSQGNNGTSPTYTFSVIQNSEVPPDNNPAPETSPSPDTPEQGSNQPSGGTYTPPAARTTTANDYAMIGGLALAAIAGISFIPANMKAPKRFEF